MIVSHTAIHDVLAWQHGFWVLDALPLTNVPTVALQGMGATGKTIGHLSGSREYGYLPVQEAGCKSVEESLCGRRG
ncbi:MAG: hypothetical protein DCC55_02100 [Chloroflexi bacterium]|nr:MAG: hypothetical protein DCC55_02100 [Chloroflexota bacterium]